MWGLGLRTCLRGLLAAGCAFIATGIATARADTLEWALVQAYQNNPSLNAQRAALRATDESVPQALSGYRPKLSVTASGGWNYFDQVNKTVNQQVFPHQVFYTSLGSDLPTRQFGATMTQTLYNGFQTANRTRQAESGVAGARETLRVTEQQVLLDAATAYMNLIRDQAILDLNRRNVEVLTEQLKQTRDRFNVGEVTRTDVAQAESRLAAGRSQLLQAQSNYITSQANYRRVIGVDPGRLAPGTPVDRLSPATLPRAITRGETQSPSVLAAMYGVDVAELAVKISEAILILGSLLPIRRVTKRYRKNFGPPTSPFWDNSPSRFIKAALNIPLFAKTRKHLASNASMLMSIAIRRGLRWCRAGANWTPPRRRSRQPPRR